MNKYPPSVYGTGLISLDIIVSTRPKEHYHWSGGTCGNVLTILSYLGWESFPIARLNSDTASVHVKADMERWGVHLDYAEQSPTTSTPIIVQENLINRQGVPVHKFHWRYCPTCGARLPNHRAVTLSATERIKDDVSQATLFFFDRTSPGAIDLAKHFKRIGAIIFFEPSAKSDLKQLKQALMLADIVKYSDKRCLEPMSDIKGATSAFLEIHTLGSEGLRYRTHVSSKLSRSWKKLSTFQAREFKDSCGCGDWTSAGLISRLCNRKAARLRELSENSVINALNYGQALAVWNCDFEGARGGMYRVRKPTFEKHIQQILKTGILKRGNRTKTPESEIFGRENCCCSYFPAVST